MIQQLAVEHIAYALLNAGITAGYVFVGIAVAPSFDLKRNWAKWAGMLFFITCGITHLEMAYYSLWMGSIHAGVTLFSFANHLVQVVAVWSFVIGLYLEYVTDKRETDKESLNVIPKRKKRKQ